MNNKMTINSQLSRNEPKRKEKQKQKLNKQPEQEQNQRNGHHTERISVGRGKGGIVGKRYGEEEA